jgi:phosphatidylserine decarboxylase
LSTAGRLAHAWNSTPIKWYPIPIALGALVLVGVQYRKQLRDGHGMKVQQQDMDGAVVDVRGGGPWQVSLGDQVRSYADLYKVQVLGALPLRSLSRLWGYLNGLVLPVWFRPFGFKLYATIFGCNLEEIEYDDLTHYESLGEFFYRRLKEGSRKIDETAAVVSPADGRVLHFGEIVGEQVEQVKGMTYSLEALLGVEGKSAVEPVHVEYDDSHREGRSVAGQYTVEVDAVGLTVSR